MAIFDFPTAQKLFHKQGKLDSISIAAKQGVTPAQLVQEMRPLLPATAQVRTGQAEAAQATKDTNGFLSIIQDFLLAFAGVALFVGIFVIANTLSITIAQRTRELATLRTLGATRRQVLGSVLVEAFVIGPLASVAGLFLGLALAKGLNALFVSFGIDLPQAGTRVRDADDRRLARRRHPDHGARGAAARAPRDAGAADLGGARGRGAARRRGSRASGRTPRSPRSAAPSR